MPAGHGEPTPVNLSATLTRGLRDDVRVFTSVTVPFRVPYFTARNNDQNNIQYSDSNEPKFCQHQYRPRMELCEVFRVQALCLFVSVGGPDVMEGRE